MSKASKMTQAKFFVGELIKHRLFGYRGVVIDVDSHFQSSDEWYDMMAKSRPPKDRPWYHVLVDGSAHSTYVAERNLLRDEALEEIDHPMLEAFFSDFSNGRYLRIEADN